MAQGRFPPGVSLNEHPNCVNVTDSIRHKVAQLRTAMSCANATTCSHLDYTGSTEIYEGAQFVVSQLVG